MMIVPDTSTTWMCHSRARSAAIQTTAAIA
jgi:hypothetical protein